MIPETDAIASYKWVKWGFGVACIYKQGLQRGGNPARVQAVSSLVWGWGEIAGECLSVRDKSPSSVNQAFNENQSLSS